MILEEIETNPSAGYSLRASRILITFSRLLPIFWPPAMVRSPLCIQKLEKRFPSPALRLGYFVFVMRKNKIESSSMNIDLFSQTSFGHGRAFNMPARSAGTKGDSHEGSPGFTAFHSAKSALCAFPAPASADRSSSTFWPESAPSS